MAKIRYVNLMKNLHDQPPHKLPKDLANALKATPYAQATWNDLTPLARNEWICWVTLVKKAETRQDHVRRVIEELLAGKRRPCCWAGCPHRQKNR
jgi:uncharacterized protein YdeI (YjbR/CyaY-like superfamily)